MPSSEKSTLMEYYQRAAFIFEWGSGGSSLFAASLPNKQIVSVESDLDFIAQLKKEMADDAENKSDVEFLHKNLGETGAWGWPIGCEHYQKFIEYPLAYQLQNPGGKSQTVLIDGRFRVACFLEVLMEAQGPVTILFDDYADRAHYRIIEKYLVPNLLIGRMGVFMLEANREKNNILPEDFARAVVDPS